jgi:hypothetical protein
MIVLAQTRGMGRPLLTSTSTKKYQQELRSLLKGGGQQVRVVLRGLALLQLAEEVGAPRTLKRPAHSAGHSANGHR